MEQSVVLPIPNADRHGSMSVSGVVNHRDWREDMMVGLSEYGWVSLDARELLEDDLLGRLRTEIHILDRSEGLKTAGIGRGNDKVRDRSVRRDKIAWLQGQTDAQADLFRFFESLRMDLNQSLFLGLKRFEAHYATYHAGDFYRKHVDSFKGRASRVISVVLYLNQDWSAGNGGALQLYNRDNELEVCGRILPEMGRMAVFLSEEIPHEVLPALDTRYSIACWFRQDEIPLPI